MNMRQFLFILIIFVTMLLSAFPENLRILRIHQFPEDTSGVPCQCIWSPDGSKYAKLLPSGRIKIFSAEGLQLDDIKYASDALFTMPGISLFSPDGVRIAFSFQHGGIVTRKIASTHPWDERNPIVYGETLIDGKTISVATFDGGDTVIYNAPRKCFSNLSIRWNSASSEIVFTELWEHLYESDIWSIDLQTRQVKDLTEDDKTLQVLPCWSEDGKLFSYFEKRNKEWFLVLLDQMKSKKYCETRLGAGFVPRQVSWTADNIIISGVEKQAVGQRYVVLTASPTGPSIESRRTLPVEDVWVLYDQNASTWLLLRSVDSGRYKYEVYDIRTDQIVVEITSVGLGSVSSDGRYFFFQTIEEKGNASLKYYDLNDKKEYLLTDTHGLQSGLGIRLQPFYFNGLYIDPDTRRLLADHHGKSLLIDLK